MNELKTKSIPKIGCLWTYFGHTSDDLWSASEYLLMTSGVLLSIFWWPLMRADARWWHLITSDLTPKNCTSCNWSAGMIEPKKGGVPCVVKDLWSCWAIWFKIPRSSKDPWLTACSEWRFYCCDTEAVGAFFANTDKQGVYKCWSRFAPCSRSITCWKLAIMINWRLCPAQILTDLWKSRYNDQLKSFREDLLLCSSS